MAENSPEFARLMLREWLRNEQRLGIAHVGVSSQPAPAGPPVAASTPPPGPPEAPPPVMPGALPLQPSPRVETVPTYSGPAELPPLNTTELTEPQARAALALIDERFVRGCVRCGLHTTRTQTVFGAGNVRPELVFVGEGPGADEDAQGVPFVGRAGQLLTKMITAMTLTRAQVFICNMVKCRPPDNRTPTEEEMDACSPYLFRQLAILRPRVIVTLGRPASQTLLGTTTPIGKLRGTFHDFPPPALAHIGLPRCKLMPTFHPAYLLRNPDAKKDAWADLKEVMRFLAIPLPGA